MVNIEAKRTCDTCTMCCKLMGVREFNKPAGEWCKLVQIGKGCGDYENRPESCMDFECLWLVSPTMPESMRPDRIKAVFFTTTDGVRSVVYIDPPTPDHWKKNFELFRVITHMRQTRDVIIVCGDKRTLLPGN